MNSTESTYSTTELDNVSTAVTEGEILQSLPGAVETVIVTLGVIINMFGVIGNGSILCVIAGDETLRKPYNALLGSMAVNDMVRCGLMNLTRVMLNCFNCIFRHLKLELLTQFPPSNDEKYYYL